MTSFFDKDIMGPVLSLSNGGGGEETPRACPVFHEYVMERALQGLEAPRLVQKPGVPLGTQKPECPPSSILKGYVLVCSELHTMV